MFGTVPVEYVLYFFVKRKSYEAQCGETALGLGAVSAYLFYLSS